jgi:hypothetical protein
MEIMALKLTSGEELIAKVTVKSENELELHDARSIMLVPGPNGGQLKLAPVLFSSDVEKPITVNRATVSVYTTNVHPKFSDEYTRSTSKLVVPKSSILMG